MNRRRAKPPGSPGSRTSLGVIFLTLFIDLAGFSIIFPLAPAMLTWYLGREGSEGLLGRLADFLAGLTPATGAAAGLHTAVLFGGLLGSLYSFLQFVAAPWWGRLSDRHGRRPILLLSIAGIAFSHFLWIFSGSFTLLILARLLAGMMSGNLSVATAAVADVTDRSNRARGMALVGVAFGLGFMVGPAIGGACALWDPTRTAPGLVLFGINPFSLPALAACLLSLANLGWVYLRFRETLPEERRHSTGVRPRLLGDWLNRAAPSGLRRAGTVYFLFILAFSGMEFTLTFLAAERLGYGPAQNAFLFLFSGLVLIVVQGVVVRRAAPRTGEKTLILAGLLAGLLGFSLLAQATHAPILYAGIALMSAGVGLVSPSLTALASLYSPEHEQGRQLGSFRSAGALGRAAGPILAALLYWSAGSTVCYLYGAGMLLLPWTIAALLPRPARATGSGT